MAVEHQVGPEAWRSRRALTLLELLVVLAIISLLLALLFPAIQAMRESARKTSCANNLSQIGLALNLYSNSHGSLPAGWIADDDAGYPGWGWGALILDELGYRNAKVQMATSTNSGASLKTNPGQSKKANGKGKGQGKSKGKALGLKDIDDADPVFLIQEISAYLCPSDSDAGITFTLHEDTTNFLSQSTTAGPVAAARTRASQSAPSNSAQKQGLRNQTPGQGNGPKPAGGPVNPGQGNNPGNGNPGNGNGSPGNGNGTPGNGNGPPGNGNGPPGNGNGNGPPGGGSPPTSGSSSGTVLLTVSRSNYAGVYGTGSVDAKSSTGDGVFYENSETRPESLDKNTTVVVGERKSDFDGTWTGAVPGAEFSKARVVGEALNTPNASLSAGLADFGSNHVGGAYFLFASSAVKFLSDGIDLKVYRALMSRNASGKGVIPADYERAP